MALETCVAYWNVLPRDRLIAVHFMGGPTHIPRAPSGPDAPTTRMWLAPCEGRSRGCSVHGIPSHQCREKKALYKLWGKLYFVAKTSSNRIIRHHITMTAAVQAADHVSARRRGGPLPCYHQAKPPAHQDTASQPCSRSLPNHTGQRTHPSARPASPAQPRRCLWPENAAHGPTG